MISLNVTLLKMSAMQLLAAVVVRPTHLIDTDGYRAVVRVVDTQLAAIVGTGVSQGHGGNDIDTSRIG